MNHTNLKAVIWSAALTVPVITLLTIIAELVPPVKDWLGVTFTQHWIGKSIMTVVVYGVLFFAFRAVHTKKNKDDAAVTGLRVLNILTIACVLTLFAFFWWHAH